jgi:multisubunit Na+/H+ antiporter MnhC subunit
VRVEANRLPQALLLTQIVGGLGAVAIFASGLKAYRQTTVRIVGELRPKSA